MPETMGNIRPLHFCRYVSWFARYERFCEIPFVTSPPHRVHGLVENPHLHGMLSHHCSLHSLVASSPLAFLSLLGVTIQTHPEGIASLQRNFDS